MSDLVLVTGISGFLGGHVALQLLNAGYAVRGSLRDLRKAEHVRETLAKAGANTARLEFVALDLLSSTGWTEAMAGVRYVQHVASPFVTSMPVDRNDLIRPAVEGTTHALEAAFSASVDRVVLTSSMAAIMYGHPKTRSTPFTAADWTALDGRGVNAYTESKTRAERAAWAIAAKHERTRDLAVINPGVILGPLLDDDPGTSAVLIQRLLNGSTPALPNMAFVIVDVRDVAALHVAAMTDPNVGGHRFPTGSGTYGFAAIADILRKGVPEYARKIPGRRVPDWLVRALGLFDRDIRGNTGELSVIKYADASDAMRLLGRPFIVADDAMLDTARSLIARGLV